MKMNSKSFYCILAEYKSNLTLITPMYHILFYKTIDNYIEKRAPFRKEHLELLKTAEEQGTLLMAGALADPADGGVFIFKTNDPKNVENFAKNDPYVKNGLITEWQVRPWTVVIGG